MGRKLFTTAVAGAVMLLAACSKPAEPAATPPAEAAPPPVAAAPAAQASESSSPPTLQRVGDCVEAAVLEVGGRLEGIPESGTGVIYDNGASQVSYDVIPAAKESKPGDKVRLCVKEVPRDCPAGDDRGFIYTATNQRTGKSWDASNSQHGCGGA